jgi:hypothetical protein
MPAETLKLGGLASEPGAAGQWHLRNPGQAGGTPGIDINVLRAWADSTGLGVRIGIIDDGFDLTHPDLAANFRGGWDSRGNNPVPQAEADDIHGTATAGLIGADDNGSGLLGVAHDATLLGFRIGFGAAGTGAQVIDALSRQAGVDVSSNSSGYTTAFADDFARARFAPLATALANAATVGRGGLGTVWVFAAGNGRQAGDNVNHHNLLNSQFAIAVAALDSAGRVASFSTPGAAVLLSAPGVAVLTTDATGSAGHAAGDTATLNGTSFATPLAAGVVGLMLEANAGLGYRDVQDILAYSARPVDLANPGWTTNAARDWNGGALRFSNDHGFGLLDATAALTDLSQRAFRAATGGPTRASLTEAYRAAAAKAREQFPDLADTFPDPFELEAQAQRRARAAQQRLDEAEAGGTGAGTWLAGAAGGMAAAILTDPLQLVTLPIGAPSNLAGSTALRVLKAAAIEGGVAAAAQAASTTLNRQAQLAAAITPDPLADIALAGAGGAVLGGGMRAAMEGWRALRARGAVNPEADQAASVAQAWEMAQAGDPGGGAPNAHATAMDQALAETAAGRPTAATVPPPSPRQLADWIETADPAQALPAGRAFVERVLAASGGPRARLLGGLPDRGRSSGAAPERPARWHGHCARADQRTGVACLE